MKSVSFIAVFCFSFLGLLKAEWDNKKYEEYTYEQFIKLPEVSKNIDVNNIDYPLMNAAIFYETNQQRKKNGVPTLKYSVSLETVAAGHSADMVKNNFFEHTSPVKGKSNMCDRFALVGGTCEYFGENIYKSPLAGTYLSLARGIVTEWAKSSKHFENMMSKNYKYLGCGSFLKNGEVYITQNYANNTVSLMKIDVATVYPQKNGNSAGASATVTKPTYAEKPSTKPTSNAIVALNPDAIYDPNRNKHAAGASSTMPVEAEAGATANNPEDGKFHVVVGSYSIQSYAQTLVNELRKKGFNNAYVIVDPNNKYRVALTGYTQREEAATIANQLTPEYPGAWLLKK